MHLIRHVYVTFVRKGLIINSHLFYYFFRPLKIITRRKILNVCFLNLRLLCFRIVYNSTCSVISLLFFIFHLSMFLTFHLHLLKKSHILTLVLICMHLVVNQLLRALFDCCGCTDTQLGFVPNLTEPADTRFFFFFVLYVCVAVTFVTAKKIFQRFSLSALYKQAFCALFELATLLLFVEQFGDE